MLEKAFREIILPAAARHGLASTTAANACSVVGDFSDERQTAAYCLAYQWRHHASLLKAFDVLQLRQEEIAQSPLVIDVGCGPATALLALGEWLSQRRAQPLNLRYIGIDRSAEMRRFAELLAAHFGGYCSPSRSIVASIDDISADKLADLARGCDGIVILMSYIMSQEFMAGGQYLVDVFRRVRGTKLPVLVIGQDANRPVNRETRVQMWPNTQLRSILNTLESWGYRNRLWDRLFYAPHYLVDADGRGVELDGDGKARTIAMAARVWLQDGGQTSRTYVPHGEGGRASTE